MFCIMTFQLKIITYLRCRKEDLCFLCLNLKPHKNCISCRENIFKDFHIPSAKHCGKGTLPFVLEIIVLCPFSSLQISEKEGVGIPIQGESRQKCEKIPGSP